MSASAKIQQMAVGNGQADAFTGAVEAILENISPPNVIPEALLRRAKGKSVTDCEIMEAIISLVAQPSRRKPGFQAAMSGFLQATFALMGEFPGSGENDFAFFCRIFRMSAAEKLAAATRNGIVVELEEGH